MNESLPLWMWASHLSPSIVALLLGFAGLRRWKKPALLLIGSALAHAGTLLGQRYLINLETAERIQKLFGIPETQSFQLLLIIFTMSGIVPTVLLLWAVFCDRDSPPPPRENPAAPPIQ